MQEWSIIERLGILEHQVQTIEVFAARVGAVESQIVQLREEMRAEFAATREQLRADITRGDEAVRTELRTEIRAGDEETRRYMRVLHEEVISRLAAMQDLRRPRRR